MAIFGFDDIVTALGHFGAGVSNAFNLAEESASESPSTSPSASESPSTSASASPSEEPFFGISLFNVETNRPQSDFSGTEYVENCIFESTEVLKLQDPFDAIGGTYHKEDFLFSDFSFGISGQGESFWVANDYNYGVGGLTRRGPGAFYFYYPSVIVENPSAVPTLPCSETDAESAEFWSYLTTFWNYLTSSDRDLFENFWHGLKLAGDSLTKKANRFLESIAPENARTCVLDDFYDIQLGPLYSIPLNLDPTIKEPNYIIRPIRKVLIEPQYDSNNVQIFRDMIEISAADYQKIRNVGLSCYVVVKVNHEGVADRYFKVYTLLSSDEPKGRPNYGEITDRLNDAGLDDSIGTLAIESLGDDISQKNIVIKNADSAPTSVTWLDYGLYVLVNTIPGLDPIGEVMDEANWGGPEAPWARFINKSGYDPITGDRKKNLPLWSDLYPVDIDDLYNYKHIESANGRYYNTSGLAWKWFDGCPRPGFDDVSGDTTKGEYQDTPSKYRYMIVVEGDLSYIKDDSFNIYLTTGLSYKVENYVTDVPILQKSVTPNSVVDFRRNLDYTFTNFVVEFLSDIFELGLAAPGDFVYCHKTPIVEHYLFDLYGGMVNNHDWNQFNYDNHSGKVAINSLLLSLQNSSTRADYERALNTYYGLPVAPDDSKVVGLYETYGYKVTDIQGDVITLDIKKDQELHKFIQPGVYLMIEGKKNYIVKLVNNRATGEITLNDASGVSIGDECHIKLENKFQIKSIFKESEISQSAGYVDVSSSQSSSAISHIIDVINALSNGNQYPEMIIYGTKNDDSNFDGIYHITRAEIASGYDTNTLRFHVYRRPEIDDPIYNDFILETKENVAAGVVHIPWPTHKFLYLLCDGEYYFKAYLDAPIDTIYDTGDILPKYSIIARNASVITRGMFPNWHQFDQFRKSHGLNYESDILELTKAIPGAKFGEFFPNSYQALN